MPIFVSEPGRPQPTRLPEVYRGQGIGTVDELNESQPAHESRNDPVDVVETQQRQAAAQRAINEYGEQTQSSDPESGAYIPVSRMATEHVHTLPASATFREGFELMERFDIHHLAIVSDERVAGLISDRWMLHWLREQPEDDRLIRFASVELPAFLTSTPETDAHQLARMMLAHRLDAALVIGPGSNPQGIVTGRDFLRLYAESSAQAGNV
ncbi:HPP family protein [Marinobacter sp. JSM 1782161]|uniref:CBS domain-containing protein n=1 Tax=Marinobacter sp. JSM 1782161 TaxID=2685906 RepID=UPI0014034C7D|nr:CBS domain-containing protein [Marinobacter sp. JSM 1782161]